MSTDVQKYLESDKFKRDKNDRIVFRHDGGVENISWVWLLVTRPFLAFTFYLVVTCVVWVTLVSTGVIGYGIRAVDQAQNAVTDAATTYFRGSVSTKR